MHNTTLSSWKIETPLGAMQAIANEKALYRLEFVDCLSQTSELPALKTAPIASIEHELNLYFEKKLRHFSTPLIFSGTPFQNMVWRQLQTVAFGTTASYSDIATGIHRPTACRALARANGKNPLLIIIPCHRIINHNGALGGYWAGLERKKWLLKHERIDWQNSGRI